MNSDADKLLDNDEVNRAALSFKNGVDRSKRMVGSMPKKSVHRVYNAVIEFPLGDNYPKFRDKKEQELFNLTLELLAAKQVMIQAVLEYQAQTKELLQDGLGGAEKTSEASGLSESTSGREEQAQSGADASS